MILNLRMVVIGVLMCVAASLALAMKPTHKTVDRRPKVHLDAMIPRHVGDWTVDPSIVPIPPSPDVQAALDKIYDETVARTYVDSHGSRIMLSIAYGGDQSDGLQAHFPEGCYEGQGFAVEEKVRGLLGATARDIPVARFMASKGLRTEPVTYWVAIGDYVVTDVWDMKKAKLAYALRGQVPDGFIVRISSISADPESAYALHADFARALLNAVPSEQRARLIGGAGGK